MPLRSCLIHILYIVSLIALLPKSFLNIIFGKQEKNLKLGRYDEFDQKITWAVMVSDLLPPILTGISHTGSHRSCRTHPRSAAGSSPPGRAGCFPSAGRSSAQTGCGGSAWTRAACSISPLPPPPSPRTSPTCRDPIGVCLRGGNKTGWLMSWGFKRAPNRRVVGFNKGTDAVSLVNPRRSSCLNNFSTS